MDVTYKNIDITNKKISYIKLYITQRIDIYIWRGMVKNHIALRDYFGYDDRKTWNIVKYCSLEKATYYV